MVVARKLSNHGISQMLSNVLSPLVKFNLVYLEPLIETLGAVANLTVDSQVQFYAGLTFEPELQEETNEYIVPLDKLPGFVNSAEWNLGISSHEMYINGSNGNYFIPRHKLHSLHPKSINSTIAPRINRLNSRSQFLLPPPMGRNSNPQSHTRYKTSRRLVSTTRFLYLYHSSIKSSWNARVT